MKKRIQKVLTIVLFVAGIATFLYPPVSMYIADMNQSQAIQNYEEDVSTISKKTIKEEYDKAEEYNKGLNGEKVKDPFVSKSGTILPVNYKEILNFHGIMAYVEIPAISVNLPIYHGTDENALQKGVGHLKETAFPIGGVGNHSVLAGHRGLPDSMLFTNLDKLKEGDIFYIHILNDTLAYKIDQIKVVLPQDTSDLKPISGKDYITLLTCTPYGVNSHRLLVRGVRTQYIPEEKPETKQDDTLLFLLIGGVAVFIILFCICVIWKIRVNYKKILITVEKRKKHD